MACRQRAGTGVGFSGRTPTSTCWVPTPIGGSGLETDGSTSARLRLVAEAPAVAPHPTALRFQPRRHKSSITPERYGRSAPGRSFCATEYRQRAATGVRFFGRTPTCTCWVPTPTGGNGLETGGSTSAPRRLVAAVPAVLRHLTALRFQPQRHKSPMTPERYGPSAPGRSFCVTEYRQ